MSKFCGKCDLYDCEVMIHGERYEKYWEGLELHVGHIFGESEIIPINGPEDLVPWYPFIEGCALGEGPIRKVWIGEKSFITTENEEMLNSYKNSFVQIYNRCKRKITKYKHDCKVNGIEPSQEEIDKLAYDADAAWKEVDSWGSRESIHELARRVAVDGPKASIEGLVWSEMVNINRKEWKKALIESGKSEEWADKWIMEH